MSESVSRRDFVERLGALGAVWMLSRPSALEGGGVAHGGAHGQSAPPQLRFFDRAEAREIEAAVERIIPSDDGPGAREAGVLYFIDGGLATFAKDQQPLFREGLTKLADETRTRFPQAARFSSLTAAQQDEVLHAVEKTPFFEALRLSTIAGMFALPSYGGNRDYVGWKALGMDTAPVFAPPFGYYDRPAVQRDLLGRKMP